MIFLKLYKQYIVYQTLTIYKRDKTQTQIVYCVHKGHRPKIHSKV